MRWTLLILNLLAAVALVYLTCAAISAHRAHAYSTYHGLVINHALVDQPTFTDGKPMDVERALCGIAASGGYYSVLGCLGAGACVLNGLFFFFLSPRRHENTA